MGGQLGGQMGGQMGGMAPMMPMGGAKPSAPAEDSWWSSLETQLMAVWAFGIVVLFTCIEFEYSAILVSATAFDDRRRIGHQP